MNLKNSTQIRHSHCIVLLFVHRIEVILIFLFRIHEGFLVLKLNKLDLEGNIYFGVYEINHSSCPTIINYFIIDFLRLFIHLFLWRQNYMTSIIPDTANLSEKQIPTVKKGGGNHKRRWFSYCSHKPLEQHYSMHSRWRYSCTNRYPLAGADFLYHLSVFISYKL